MYSRTTHITPTAVCSVKVFTTAKPADVTKTNNKSCLDREDPAGCFFIDACS